MESSYLTNWTRKLCVVALARAHCYCYHVAKCHLLCYRSDCLYVQNQYACFHCTLNERGVCVNIKTLREYKYLILPGNDHGFGVPARQFVIVRCPVTRFHHNKSE